jgi:hypothetical protein
MNRGDIWLIDLGRKIGSKAYKIYGHFGFHYNEGSIQKSHFGFGAGKQHLEQIKTNHSL